MVELPKTETELQGLIDDAVKKATDTLKSEYDGKFATQRKKHDEEIAKIKADAGKSVEELAQERIREQQEKDANELAELRAYKKQNILGEKLQKEGLPSFLKNDSRLISAEDGDIDKTIKVIKKEWEDTLPKGNQHSSVIKTGGQPSADDKDTAKEECGQALKELVGR